MDFMEAMHFSIPMGDSNGYSSTAHLGYAYYTTFYPTIFVFGISRAIDPFTNTFYLLWTKYRLFELLANSLKVFSIPLTWLMDWHLVRSVPIRAHPTPSIHCLSMQTLRTILGAFPGPFSLFSTHSGIDFSQYFSPTYIFITLGRGFKIMYLL